ncbi:hypothetical protein [Paenibacillus sp. XY044]|uniref:hypothetical protein n=1 Tax=Paenibacillus sp. XY044 TaxID=2026089 RepID=UPI0015C5DA89|nr:hypothetical protein [Paenibacillus sp. XY044]
MTLLTKGSGHKVHGRAALLNLELKKAESVGRIIFAIKRVQKEEEMDFKFFVEKACNRIVNMVYSNSGQENIA